MYTFFMIYVCVSLRYIVCVHLYPVSQVNIGISLTYQYTLYIVHVYIIHIPDVDFDGIAVVACSIIVAEI